MNIIYLKLPMQHSTNQKTTFILLNFVIVFIHVFKCKFINFFPIDNNSYFVNW